MSESPTETHEVTDTAAVYAMQIPRPTDDQDRVLPEHLTEREMLVELVNYMRGFTDLMTQLADNQAGSGLMGMLGKMMGITPEMLKRK